MKKSLALFDGKSFYYSYSKTHTDPPICVISSLLISVPSLQLVFCLDIYIYVGVFTLEHIVHFNIGKVIKVCKVPCIKFNFTQIIHTSIYCDSVYV